MEGKLGIPAAGIVGMGRILGREARYDSGLRTLPIKGDSESSLTCHSTQSVIRRRVPKGDRQP